MTTMILMNNAANTRPANLTLAKLALDAAVAKDTFAANDFRTIYLAAKMVLKSGRANLAYSFLRTRGLDVNAVITDAASSPVAGVAVLGRILANPSKYHAA